MRSFFLLSLATLLACAPEPDGDPGSVPAAPTEPAPRMASPSAAPPDSFDVQAWLADVRALDAADYDSLLARSRRLADRLDAEVNWRRACDAYRDHETGEEVYTPADPEQEAMVGRGLMEATMLGAREAVVAVQCDRGAYQGTWALAHVEGNRVALVRAPELGEGYQPTGFETATFGQPTFEPEGAAFSTFVRSRGIGDCGALTRYRLGTGGAAEVLEVRARECTDDIPDALPPPEEWPVVYPR